MSEEKKVENKLTLSPGALAGYFLGGMFPCGWVLVITGYYLMAFMTECLHLDTTIAATAYSAVQWWKLIGMVLSGFFIDGIALKSGRYRGWNLIMGIVMGISFPLAFMDFGIKNQATAAIVVFVLEAVLMLAYNVYWTALRTLPAKMGKTSQDINWLNVMSAAAGATPSLLWGLISAGLLAWASAKFGESNRFMGICLIFGAVIIICAVIMFNVAKKYDGPENAVSKDAMAGQKQKNVGLIEILKNLSGPMIPYFISQTLASAEAGFFNTLLVYYCTYVLKNPNISAKILMVQSLISLLGSFLVPSLTKFLTKKASHILAHGVYAVCYVVLGIFGTSVAVFYAVRILMSVVGCVTNVVMYGFPLDIADYNEMKGLDPKRGILTAIGGTTIRLGFAASTTIASFGLAAIGYQNGVPVDAAMEKKIVLLFVGGPAILAALSALIMLFYKVDEREIDRYRAERAAKKAAQ